MRIPTIVTLCAALVVAGCGATPSPEIVPLLSPADPGIGQRHVQYSPVLGGYQPRKPTGPDDWRKLNDRLSPGYGGEGP